MRSRAVTSRCGSLQCRGHATATDAKRPDAALPHVGLNRPLSGVVLVLAGVYELTRFKRSCLKHCRSPAELIVEQFRPGTMGALRMGFEHGLYCLGCCWALMLVLFVGGVMNLWVIAAISLFILFEKLAPFGMRAAQFGGALLILAGFWAILGPMIRH